MKRILTAGWCRWSDCNGKLFLPLIAKAAVCGLLILTGCSMTSGSRVAPDGSTLRLSTTRFFWASEGVRFVLVDTNGVRVELSFQKSSVDAQAVSAAVGAAVEAAAKGMKP